MRYASVKAVFAYSDVFFLSAKEPVFLHKKIAAEKLRFGRCPSASPPILRRGGYAAAPVPAVKRQDSLRLSFAVPFDPFRGGI